MCIRDSRITVGRGIAQGNVELRARGAHENEEVAIENVVTYLQNKLQ